MQQFDTVMKAIFTRPRSFVPAVVGAAAGMRWLNGELPKVRNLRVDLLGESPEGELVQIEFQSRNEKRLPYRMGEYLFAIARTHRRLPRQIVLYVGDARLRMEDRIEARNLSFRFHLVDIRDLDGEALLASPEPGDNVIAILTRLGEQPGTVRRILERLASAEDRNHAVAEFLIVAALRRRVGEVTKEAEKMPILNSIMQDPFLKSLVTQGRSEGRVEGRSEAQTDILTLQIQKRFGALTPDLRRRLAGLSPDEANAVALRLLDAERVDDLLLN
jgi:predicted transposase YdaD